MSSAGSSSSPLTDRDVQALLQDVLVPCGSGQDEPGDVLGPYRLVAKLGEGGFGVVWQAEQSRPVQREVAVKMIKLGMDSREVLARFEQERQVLPAWSTRISRPCWTRACPPTGGPILSWNWSGASR